MFLEAFLHLVTVRQPPRQSTTSCFSAAPAHASAKGFPVLDGNDTFRGRLRNLFRDNPFRLACEYAFDLSAVEGRRRVCRVDGFALDLVNVDQVQTVSCKLRVSIGVAVDKVVDCAFLDGGVRAVGVDDVLHEREETIACEKIAAEDKGIRMQ